MIETRFFCSVLGVRCKSANTGCFTLDVFYGFFAIGGNMLRFKFLASLVLVCLLAFFFYIGSGTAHAAGIVTVKGSAQNGWALVTETALAGGYFESGSKTSYNLPDIGGGETTSDLKPQAVCTTICYVNTTTGNDSNDGDTPGNAKKTIQAAVNQVSSGGQVVVAAGTYNENVVINKNGITLEGAVAFNPNDVPNPSVHTIISSGSPAVITSPGIQINSGITGVTIKNLRVENFASSSGILGVVGNDGLTIDSVQVYGNNTNGMPVSGGIYMNGPVSNVTINKADVQNNKSRGIVIWNGFKQNITFTNNYIKGNNCCGIELQDGTASGVTVTGNTVLNNSDSGMAFIGLMAGAGPNLIANNTLTDNGRFGIEIKLPNGTGQTSGDGSIVVENNTVSMTGAIVDQRDMAGISVYRRGWVSGNNNVDIPQGVVIRNNTVSGYQQSSNSDGFGIVVEGAGMSVYGNTLNNNDVGIQQQAGHLPYTPNTNVDGDQSNLPDQYFGRGNSPVGCAAISSNTFSGNTVDTRSVGTSGGSVTNVNTGRFFCSIQSAIDDANTLNGHTLNVGAGTYVENVVISKSLELAGASQAGVIVQPAVSDPNCGGAGGGSLCSGASNVFLVQASNVTIHDLTVDGDNPSLTSAYNVGGANLDARNGIIINNLLPGPYNNFVVYNTTVKNIYLRGIYAYGGTFNLHDNTVTNVQAEGASIAMFNFSGSGFFTDNTVSYANDGISSNWSKGTEYSGNTVTNSGSGVHTDNNGGSGGSADNIHDNTVSDCTAGGYGVWVFVPYNNVIVNSNDVSNCEISMSLFGGQGGTPTFSNNTVDGNNIANGAGMYISTDTFGYGDMNAAATLNGNSFTNAETGMYIDRTGSATLNVTETSDTFTGSTIGIDTDTNLTTSNVTATATGDALLVRSGGSVTANNSLDLNGNATISTGGTLGAGTSSEIKVAGNWTNNGTFTAGTGKVKFDGAVAQSIGGANPTTFNDLDLSNTHTSGITSSVNLTVNGALAMNQDSNLNMGANTLTMGTSSAAATSGSGQGDVIGQVTRTSFTSGTTYNFGSPFLAFNNLTFTTAPTDISVTLATSAPGTFPSAILRTYSLNVNGGSNVNTDLRLHYRDDALNGNSEVALAPYRFDGTTWGLLATSARNTIQNWVERSGVSTFSDWTLANSAPTSVNLLSFTANKTSAAVELKWQTGAELNLLGFNIWRSRGKAEFKKINADLIPVKSPGGVLGNDYSYSDSIERGGKYKYKLEIVTVTGESEWSEIVQVRLKRPNACASALRAPKFLEPQAQAKLSARQITLKWEALKCAEYYNITIREGTVDGVIVAQGDNLNTTEYKSPKLSRGRTYFATVGACNAAGCGETQSVEFTIKRKRE